ncbi:hypothetical protein F8568_032410 [Actinomadura sp. LD22]|uniref:Tyr recombinase domain-containing protein n=1 Tax=Actinomadura physcomitrii TaxID=2650748 RepID=A0A6I4MFI8_9ACTN|nr:hypothetical protein [Actinomadura physcomitrii]MWA04988.1 hypothetical protein [Actinomadura physcomitrii]
MDFAVDERLYALFHLVAFRGLRRAEVAGLSWQDTDLKGSGTIIIRETLPDQGDGYDDTKSEAGERTVALDSTTISVLPAWRERQQEERLAAGAEVWVDSGGCSPRWTADASPSMDLHTIRRLHREARAGPPEACRGGLGTGADRAAAPRVIRSPPTPAPPSCRRCRRPPLRPSPLSFRACQPTR